MARDCNPSKTQRVLVPNNWVLGIWVIVVMVLVLGKSIITRSKGEAKTYVAAYMPYTGPRSLSNALSHRLGLDLLFGST